MLTADETWTPVHRSTESATVPACDVKCRRAINRLRPPVSQWDAVTTFELAGSDASILLAAPLTSSKNFRYSSATTPLSPFLVNTTSSLSNFSFTV